MYKTSIVTNEDQVDPYKFYDLLVEAIRESKYSENLNIDYEMLKGAALHYTKGDIDNSCLVLLHCDDEAVGFLCGEVGFMSRYFQMEPIASETLWWISPEHRGKAGKAVLEMVDLFEQWGLYNGCSIVTMSNQQNEYTAKVAKLYESIGYLKFEECFMKKLSAREI